MMIKAVCRVSLAAAFLFLIPELVIASHNLGNMYHPVGVASKVQSGVYWTTNSPTACNYKYGRSDLAHHSWWWGASHAQTGTALYVKCKYASSGSTYGTISLELASSACAAGYHDEGGVCVVDPPCTSGETLDVSYYTDTGSAGGYLRMISLSEPEVTTNIDGCEVTYTPSYDDCYYSGETVTGPSGDFERTVCNVTATKTGNNSSAQTEETAGLSSGQSSSLGDKCIAGADGDVLCADINPQNCGEINGVDVCFNGGQASCYDIDGTTICAGGAQNCGIFNGINLCVEQNDSESYVKFSDGSKEVKVSKNKGRVNTTVETTVHPDGSKTVVTTTTSNIVGIPSSVKTDNYDPSGNLTDSTTTGADGPDQGDKFDTTGLATEAGQNAINSTLNQIKDAVAPDSIDTSGISGEGDGVEASYGTDKDAFIAGLGSDMPTETDWLTWAPSFPEPACQSMALVIPMGPIGNKNLDFDPCTDLEVMRDILGWVLYIGTGFVLVRLTLRGSGS